jgi:hypothetical protein
MRKAFLFFAMIVTVGLVGCAEKPSFNQMRVTATERLDCLSKGFLIDHVDKVTVYRSGAVEVSHTEASQDPSVFLSPSDRLTFPNAVEDLPEGREVVWAELRPMGAWIVSRQLPLQWTCLFNLQVHVHPGSASQVIDDKSH